MDFTCRLKISLLILVPILISGVSFAQESFPFQGIAKSSEINVRSDATISSKVVCKLNQGDKVDVVSESYDWYRIRFPKKASVYVKANLAECIKFEKGADGIESSNCLSAKVLRNRVNVRILPDESGAIIGVVDENEIINVRGKEAGWYIIEPIQNSFAWVHRKFIDKAPTNVTLSTQAIPGNDNVVLKGQVLPYGMVFRRTATHKLVTLDNKIYLLNGNRASLNALNRSKVKVIGNIISSPKTRYPVVQVKIIEAEN
jgi:uncharacterized protein YgiM (DUF1202 family)